MPLGLVYHKIICNGNKLCRAGGIQGIRLVLIKFTVNSYHDKVEGY